jgi:predicted amidophosphoribosyltransferase
METLSPPSAVREEAGSERELCISCLQPNPPGTHFCRHCGTPLTAYAATAPFESVFAEGDFWRKALRPGRGSRVRRVAIGGFLFFMILAILIGWLLPR